MNYSIKPRASLRRALLAAFNEQSRDADAAEFERVRSLHHPSVQAWRDAGNHAETWQQWEATRPGPANA